eukprot:TRINITY_DN6032_c1_g1_i5.p1 TRINITY_DN6032_c1_g1~~TRINITY_DN6032_c1_g1_i5.p1  ORF type:complete len:318 (-),score=65.85 TRINITY_DN6032_c1_g1_i5:102-1055(-)
MSSETSQHVEILSVNLVPEELTREEYRQKLKERGILAQLQSVEGFESFRSYLTQMKCVESLDFWKRVELFKMTPPAKLVQSSVLIWNEFLSHKAVKKINITYNLRDPVEAMINEKKATETMFNAVQNHVFKLFKQNYWIDYLKSDLCNQYVERQFKDQKKNPVRAIESGKAKWMESLDLFNETESHPSGKCCDLEEIFTKLKSKKEGIPLGTKPLPSGSSFTFCFTGAELLQWCKAQMDRPNVHKICDDLVEHGYIYNIDTTNTDFHFSPKYLYHFRVCFFFHEGHLLAKGSETIRRNKRNYVRFPAKEVSSTSDFV